MRRGPHPRSSPFVRPFFPVQSSQNSEGRNKVPVFLPKELPRKFLAPVVSHVLPLTIFRPDNKVNMVAKFVIEDISDRQVAKEGYPKDISRPTLKNLIYVELDPWRLSFPFLVIKASHARLRNAPTSARRFAKSFPSRLTGQIRQHDAVKAERVPLGRSGK